MTSSHAGLLERRRGSCLIVSGVLGGAVHDLLRVLAEEGVVVAEALRGRLLGASSPSAK